MDNSEKLLPDFLLIGAAKSGTSSVAQYLAQHPNIYMCPVKEPHYFSYNDKSKHTTGPGDVIHKAITNYEDYKGLFLKAPIDSLKGEASTSYLYREEAPYRIREMIPNVKLIAILRNPIDRAYSAYMHQVRDGNETASTFREGLALEKARRKAGWDSIWHYTEVGRYSNQLSRYFKIFPRKNIRIFLYEELSRNSNQLMSDIFKFLELKEDIIIDTQVHENVSGEVKKPLLWKHTVKLLETPNLIKRLTQKFIPLHARQKGAAYLRSLSLSKSEMQDEDRKYLEELFQEEILKLSELIGRDCSHWLFTSKSD